MYELVNCRLQLIESDSVDKEIRTLLILEMVYEGDISLNKAKELFTELGIFSDHWIEIESKAAKVINSYTDEILIDLELEGPEETIHEAMHQKGYVLKGVFKYDYPEYGHKWYERIKTELFEKDNKLYYVAGVPGWEGEQISVIRIGEIENKKYKNPECIFDL